MNHFYLFLTLDSHYIQSSMDPSFAATIKDAYEQEENNFSNLTNMFKSFLSVSGNEFFQTTINNADLSDTTKAFLKKLLIPFSQVYFFILLIR